MLLPLMGRLAPWLDQHTSSELQMALRIMREGVAPVLVLHGLCVAARECDRLINEAVIDIRAEGRSWAEVGEAMGISRQAARRRFIHLEQPAK